jgi:virginiamycin B lyase
MKTLLMGATASVALLLFAYGSPASAQRAAAISGSVSSAEDGAMEGVLVSAKKNGSNKTVTVVSDAKGHYRFPAARLEPGHYQITIRAVGYDLDGTPAADVAAGKAAASDIKLKKTRNLALQLSNAEWLMSMPGDDKMKSNLNGCNSCHTYQRILRSAHTSEEFQEIFQRMGHYSPGSTPIHPQPLLPGPRGNRPRVAADKAKALGDYLASVNLSTNTTWNYPLKTLPRPQGQATHVIITEYDLKRPEAQPHDVIRASDGQIFYSDFGNQFIGQLDPKSGKVTDYPVPVLKPNEPKGLLQVDTDPQGNVWGAMMYQGGIAKLDRKTGKVTAYPIPKEWQSASTQESMVSPTYANVDGYVWTNNQEMHALYRLNVKTGQFENMGAVKFPGTDKTLSAYGMPVDQHNKLYMLEFGNTNIGHYDPVTKQVKVYKTPTPGSKPRRGRVDGQGRLWFAEYGGNAIGMFDPKTEQVKEFRLSTPWSDPYDVVADKSGKVWAGSMYTDEVNRLDPSSGKTTDYLLPRSTNIRRVFADNTTNPPSLWVGSNHGASIVHVEPLD